MHRRRFLPRLRRRVLAVAIGSAAGFSTIETAGVISAVSIASATAAPHLQGYLEMAHRTKATGDVRVIALSIFRLTNDVGLLGARPQLRPALLVSAGEIPGGEGPAVTPWTGPVDHRETQTLDAHLVTNDAGYDERWRGPYFEGLMPDPWGSRYSSNVGVLFSGRNELVVVLSPGPNRIVETPYALVGLRILGDDIASVVGRGY